MACVAGGRWSGVELAMWAAAHKVGRTWMQLRGVRLRHCAPGREAIPPAVGAPGEGMPVAATLAPAGWLIWADVGTMGFKHSVRVLSRKESQP